MNNNGKPCWTHERNFRKQNKINEHQREKHEQIVNINGNKTENLNMIGNKLKTTGNIMEKTMETYLRSMENTKKINDKNRKPLTWTKTMDQHWKNEIQWKNKDQSMNIVRKRWTNQWQSRENIIKNNEYQWTNREQSMQLIWNTLKNQWKSTKINWDRRESFEK